MKMLVADDELNNRVLMGRLLEPYGTVDLVIDGREAVDAFLLAHAENEPYDFIFMDIMMPNMDGHQAVQAIRGREAEWGILSRQEAKVIMVTALDSPREAMRSYYHDGCTDYMTKPITKQKIEHILQRVAGRAEQSDGLETGE
ncbi:MAG: response regulator [Magnetococcales bacterium]|nr:response regulator [Magnetococcales bacterium]MBF0114785.1 response regulator [Magnetococcales bacterium]